MNLQVEDVPSASSPRLGRPKRHWSVVAAAAVVLLCVVILGIVYLHNWPFTRQAVMQALEQQAGATIQMSGFHEVYFPHPGCVADGVSFRSATQSAGPPFITIQKLTIVGSYVGLLAHHISSVRADGLHITVPPREQAQAAGTPGSVGALRSGITIGELVADGAELDVATESGKEPLVFRIEKLRLSNLAAGHPMGYQTLVHIPQPPADLTVNGKFGPWQPDNAGQTQLSGNYLVRNMDLGVFNGIAGTLMSKGSFTGILQHVQVQGKTDMPNFGITRSGHSLPLKTEFQATVNGLNGDVAFDPATVHFARTTIVAAGTVAGTSDTPGLGKTLTMQAYSDGARVQDLVRLVIREPVSPMLGAIVFRAKVILPPDDRPFLDKVQLQGDFGIAGGQYTNPDTQKDVDVLSARARGKADQVEDEDDKRGNDSYDPGRVISNVKGQVAVHNGVAHLSNVTFDVPGASAKVNGTYDLNSERLNFAGQMHLDTKLSKATTGVKSFLLKIIQPLTASKKGKGADVTLEIGGTYHHPTYTALPESKK